MGITGEVYIYYNHEDAMKSIETLGDKIPQNVKKLIEENRDVCKEGKFLNGEDTDVTWIDLKKIFKNSLNNIIIIDNSKDINSFLPSNIVLSIFSQIKFYFMLLKPIFLNNEKILYIIDHPEKYQEIINNLMKQIEQMNSGLKELKKDALNTSIPNKLILNKTKYIFNEDSPYCMVPYRHRILHKLADTNEDGIVTEDELTNAIQTLEKAKKHKQDEKREKLAIDLKTPPPPPSN